MGSSNNGLPPLPPGFQVDPIPALPPGFKLDEPAAPANAKQPAGKSFGQQFKENLKKQPGLMLEAGKGLAKTIGRDLYEGAAATNPVFEAAGEATGLTGKVEELTEPKTLQERYAQYATRGAESLVPIGGESTAARAAGAGGRAVVAGGKDVAAGAAKAAAGGMLAYLHPGGTEIGSALVGAGLGIPGLKQMGEGLRSAWKAVVNGKTALEDLSAITQKQLAHRLYEEVHGAAPKTAQESVDAIRELRQSLKGPAAAPKPKLEPKAPVESVKPATSPFASHTDRLADQRKQFFSVLGEKGLNPKITRARIQELYGKGYSELTYEQRSALQTFVEQHGSLPPKPLN
jgi:hypothetical protein